MHRELNETRLFIAYYGLNIITIIYSVASLNDDSFDEYFLGGSSFSKYGKIEIFRPN